MIRMLRLLLSLILCLSAAPSGLAKDKKPKHKGKTKAGKVIEDDKEPWACVKNDKILPVKGKNDREKQDRCEAQFGIWEKKRHALQDIK